MKAILLVLIFTLSSSVFANTPDNLTDEAGERCIDKAARIAKQYFDVAETQEKIGFVISKDDTVTALNFKNTTPGSYNQDFVSDLKVKIDRTGNKYRPKKDQKIRIKFGGDFDCDNLKVKNVQTLGGVERID
ncbi:MAG: hypothetical protein PHY93_12785 [Bacteriovorax sp.]|nr:hypothetical protein [Bacteriovorax sp.]